VFSAGVSCEAYNKLAIVIFINVCPKTPCKTSYCFSKCVPEIKLQTLSKFGSTLFLFNIKTVDGAAFSILIQFCSFGQVVSGKKDKSKRISVSSDNTYTKYERATGIHFFGIFWIYLNQRIYLLIGYNTFELYQNRVTVLKVQSTLSALSCPKHRSLPHP